MRAEAYLHQPNILLLKDETGIVNLMNAVGWLFAHVSQLTIAALLPTESLYIKKIRGKKVLILIPIKLKGRGPYSNIGDNTRGCNEIRKKLTWKGIYELFLLRQRKIFAFFLK